jgi:hypothetical protein
MDPGKRSHLGAHYTSREDVETLVEPVVMKPLRREWGGFGASPTGRVGTFVPAGQRGCTTLRPSIPASHGRAVETGVHCR